jgi:hypothetical protein
VYTIYYNLRPIEDTAVASWSIYATWYDEDNDQHGKPVGETEWEVPEWTGLGSERQALKIIEEYADGWLAADLCPCHPHFHKKNP